MLKYSSHWILLLLRSLLYQWREETEILFISLFRLWLLSSPWTWHVSSWVTSPSAAHYTNKENSWRKNLSAMFDKFLNQLNCFWLVMKTSMQIPFARKWFGYKTCSSLTDLTWFLWKIFSQQLSSYSLDLISLKFELIINP